LQAVSHSRGARSRRLREHPRGGVTAISRVAGGRAGVSRHPADRWGEGATESGPPGVRNAGDKSPGGVVARQKGGTGVRGGARRTPGPQSPLVCPAVVAIRAGRSAPVCAALSSLAAAEADVGGG